MSGKSKGPKLTHECCSHLAGVCGFNPGPDGKPTWLAQTRVCCHCGQARVEYVGIVEPGHGPFVSYQKPEPAAGLVQAKAGLILPGR